MSKARLLDEGRLQTQLPVDRQFRPVPGDWEPVSIVLNNDNRPEQDWTASQPLVEFWTRGGAVKYEVDTGVRPALQQAGALGESTGSKNEGSLGESMIFGIQWQKNTKICGVIGWEPKVHKKVGSLGGT